jgi:hypothetical protein
VFNPDSSLSNTIDIEMRQMKAVLNIIKLKVGHSGCKYREKNLESIEVSVIYEYDEQLPHQ